MACPPPASQPLPGALTGRGERAAEGEQSCWQDGRSAPASHFLTGKSSVNMRKPTSVQQAGEAARSPSGLCCCWLWP